MREPPRALTVALFAALTALLVYPLHRPYLHPDQDLPATLPLFHMASPTWVPRIINMYGSALPNAMHVFEAIALRVGRIAGWWSEPVDMLVAWCQAPWLFRMLPRAFAMAFGLASLVAVRRTVALAANGWSALAAPAILGTWLLFVREHHHGLYDAPASGAAMLALWAAASHIRAPSLARIVAAGALAGLATSFKYNLAPTVPAVIAATAVVDRTWRVRTVLVAGVAAAVAFVVTSPEILIDHARWRAYMETYIPLQHRILTGYAGSGGNQLLVNFGLGMGWIGLALAGMAFVVTAVAHERVLVPVLAFVVLYGAVLANSPLAIIRYLLPITGPLAVLIGFALSRLPRPVAAIVTVALVGIGLPACIEHIRFLAIEDTRVEAARLVEAERARGGRVLLAANPVLGVYSSPDVPQLPHYTPDLPPAVAQEIAERVPLCTQPIGYVLPADAEALRAHAGALVVTTDAPTPTFATSSTPPDVMALLEGEATLVADLEIERWPAERRYEKLDLNYVPFTGLGSLRRPGPRLRVWRIPAR